jgi:FkbM family methyltransferase
MSTLIYIGANDGHTLWSLFDKFDNVYAFEPDPEVFSELNRKFRQFEWVTLVNAACSDFNGKSKFYVTNNKVASSLGNPSEEFQKEYLNRGAPASVFSEIEVETINLGEYLKNEGVEFIDLYYSDCQGSDLTILNTMKEFIDGEKIGELFIETHGDGSKIYVGLNNQFSEFKKILEKNYDFIHACMGSYGEGNASPSRVKLDGQIVTEEYILDVTDWGVSNPEWDSYWKLKEYPFSIGQSLRS